MNFSNILRPDWVSLYSNPNPSPMIISSVFNQGKPESDFPLWNYSCKSKVIYFPFFIHESDLILAGVNLICNPILLLTCFWFIRANFLRKGFNIRTWGIFRFILGFCFFFLCKVFSGLFSFPCWLDLYCCIILLLEFTLLLNSLFLFLELFPFLFSLPSCLDFHSRIVLFFVNFLLFHHFSVLFSLPTGLDFSCSLVLLLLFLWIIWNHIRIRIHFLRGSHLHYFHLF